MKTFASHVAVLVALVAFVALTPREARAACTDNAAGAAEVWSAVQQLSNHIRFAGACTEDNEELIVTNDVSGFDACVVMSTTGAIDVFVSLDGTNYSTAPLSLQDFGATDTSPVLVTAALRVYGFVGKFVRIKIIENGATDAAASLNCWKL
jgi:hypothetical protein